MLNAQYAQSKLHMINSIWMKNCFVCGVLVMGCADPLSDQVLDTDIDRPASTIPGGDELETTTEYWGTNGPDFFEGTEASEAIYGLEGDDVLRGGDGDDLIDGGEGDDDLEGGEGNDILRGGDGDDMIFGGSGHDQLFGGSGDDLYIFTEDSGTIEIYPNGRGYDILKCDGPTIMNEIEDDTSLILEMSNGGSITIIDQLRDGTGLPNQLEEGNDYTIDELINCIGEAGANIIQGTPDPDELEGTDGVDHIFGKESDDTIRGGAAPDRLYGHDGNDHIEGGEGDDIIEGGKGDDVLYGGLGDDTLKGDEGNDQLYGGEGNDTYIFQANHQNITIHPDGGGEDRLICYNDTVMGSTQEGEDLILQMNGGGVIRIVSAYLTATVDSFSGCGAVLPPVLEDQLVDDSERINDPNPNPQDPNPNPQDPNPQDPNPNPQDPNNGFIEPPLNPNQPSDDSDILVGTEGNDMISGLGGNDQISGSDGDDFINGNDGDDFVNGNNGNDIVRGGQGDDVVRGGQGNDIVYGDRGNDHLYGDRGDDTYVYEATHDTITIHPDGEGNDTLRCDGVFRLIEVYEGNHLVFLMSNGGKIVILDQLLGSTIDRFEGCRQLYNLDSMSQILGGAGSEAIDGDASDNAISGLDGNDTIRGLDGNDFINGNNGDDTINGNNGNDLVRGGQGNDIVRGGQGNDVVTGDRGNDLLYGDLGDDYYVYQETHEHIAIYPGDGFDRLVCFGTKVIREEQNGGDLLLIFDNNGSVRLVGGPGAVEERVACH